MKLTTFQQVVDSDNLLMLTSSDHYYDLHRCQMLNLSNIFIFQFKAEMVDTLYNYAKFQYECGNYSAAAEYLYFVRILVSSAVNMLISKNT